MKKATRILALVLALLMIAVVGLTGCKKDEGGSGDGNKTEVNKDEWKELTLEYWTLGPGAQELDATIQEAADKMLGENGMPNTKVNITWIPGGEIKDKTTRALAAEENVDMVWLGWHWSKDEKYEMARDEVLLPIDKDICKYYLDYIGEMERKAISVDGEDYFFIGWHGLA